MLAMRSARRIARRWVVFIPFGRVTSGVITGMRVTQLLRGT